MQQHQLRLGATFLQKFFGKGEEVVVIRVFFGQIVQSSDELLSVGTSRNSRNCCRPFMQTLMVGEPRSLEAGTIGQGDKTVMDLRLIIHYAIQSPSQRQLCGA